LEGAVGGRKGGVQGGGGGQAQVGGGGFSGEQRTFLPSGRKTRCCLSNIRRERSSRGEKGVPFGTVKVNDGKESLHNFLKVSKKPNEKKLVRQGEPKERRRREGGRGGKVWV